MLERLKSFVSGKKSVQTALPTSSAYKRYDFTDRGYDELAEEGYGRNSAVAACVAQYAVRYPEAPLCILDENGAVDEKHPLNALLESPNPDMDQDTLKAYIAIYKAIGGNCYLHILRGRDGFPVQLWPYNDSQFAPVPGPNNAVAYYLYDIGDGNRQKIPVEDVIHLRWPSIDHNDPWKSLAPLRMLSPNVDADNLLTQTINSLLEKNAIPGGILSFPAGSEPSKEIMKLAKEQMKESYGGTNKGEPMVVAGGVTYQRVASNLDELNTAPLRGHDESRICGVYLMPPSVAGLYVGLENNTYSNNEGQMTQFAENVLCPMWKQDASAISRKLLAKQELGSKKVKIAYDLSKVLALQKRAFEKREAYRADYEAGGLKLDEYRELIGQKPVGGDLGESFFQGKYANLTLG